MNINEAYRLIRQKLTTWVSEYLLAPLVLVTGFFLAKRIRGETTLKKMPIRIAGKKKIP